MAIDPVCGMQVDVNTAKYTYAYMGETYYFCSPGCKASFEKEPEKYLHKDMSHQEHQGHHHHH